ncbi:MAG: peptidylprolyl isomerase [Deltaproteobacteria bacterium HGW-Deltaproteobacteria-23]|nr:MAG: peptidylprolyl isomerase [Deltaproteobacteria bacterium HGW-Deltaproteobacteria-23]
MKKFVIAVLVILAATPLLAADKPQTATKPYQPVKLKTEEQKSLYGVGLVIARQLAVFNLSPAELKIVKQGITDGVRGKKPRVDFAKYSKKSQELGVTRRDVRGKKLEVVAGEFIEDAAAEAGAIKTKSGLVYKSLKEGEGAGPSETSKVKLHYVSTLIDGWEIDSSYKRGKPDEIELNNYFKCLSEGVQLMKPGGKARLVCPPEIALGKEGSGIIPPNATLVFVVELFEILPSDITPEDD